MRARGGGRLRACVRVWRLVTWPHASVSVVCGGGWWWTLMRNDLLPPRYSVCGLRRFRLPAEVPAEFRLGVRY